MLKSLVLVRLPLLIAAIVAINLSIQASYGQASRQHILMDAGWKFQLAPPVTPTSGNGQTWKYEPASGTINDADATLPDGIFDVHASTATSGEDVFNNRVGFAWFQQTISGTLKNGKRPNAIHFEPVDDNATVYVNGTRVFHHEGWSEPFDVPIPSNWSSDTNVITVLVENTAGRGSVGDVTAIFQTEFHAKEANFDFQDSRWRTVHLPHDFVIEGKFAASADAGKGGLPRGQAWYRKHFFLPKAVINKSIWVDFEGAFSDAKVWLNGHLLGEHRSGYTGFRFDLTKYANFGGDNVLAVYLDATKTEGWWYEGGGIYRHVYLTIANSYHIAPLSTYFRSNIKGIKTSSPSADLTCATSIQNGSQFSSALTVAFTVHNPAGQVVGTSYSHVVLNPYALLPVQAVIHLKNVQLWSLEKPTLYSISTQVYRQQMLDEKTTTFGFRTLRFDPELGFFLNEKPVKLQGTCNHQDFVGVGIGMPDTVLSWRIRKLKEMGSNAYRCSHNEVAPELLDACDRQGMLVMDENREFGDTFTGKANRHTTTNDLSDLQQEVRRDRNHPSIIMWSLGNEEWEVQGNSDGVRIASALKAAVLNLDTTRPISMAMNGGHFEPGVRLVLDLEGFNYGPQEYARFHEMHPDHPMFGSETASTVTTRGIYTKDDANGHVPAYDTQGTQTAQDAWEPIGAHSYMAGGFVWTGFDYKGEPTPYSWPDINSNFGIMDMCGFPKDIYYYYQAWWINKPSVHVFPHWTWPGKEGEEINVWAFGNGDEVELFLNGKSLGKKPMPKFRHAEWNVVYEPGILKVVSYKDGAVVATDIQKTAGAPYALRVKSEPTNLHANSEDCAMVEVSVVDKNGIVCPESSNMVQFKTVGAGTIAGVGNGDPSCHEPDVASTRSAYKGLCLGLVRTTDKSGIVTCIVSSPGLKSARISFKVKQ